MWPDSQYDDKEVNERLTTFMKLVIPFLAIIFLPLFFSQFFLMSGDAHIDYSGIAVHKDGNLYIGSEGNRTEGKMYVIDPSGNLVETFKVPAYSPYEFTVTETAVLVISYRDISVLDLHGRVIKEGELPEQLRRKIQLRQTEVVTEDGKVYTMKTHFLRTIVQVQEGETVRTIYEMPMLDYVVKIMFVSIFIAGFLYIPFAIYRIRGGFSHKRSIRR